MGTALVIGLMLGLGGALLRDMLDQRLRSAEEIAHLLDLPILGAVPHMIGKPGTGQCGQEIRLKPRSDVAEAYRTIRTGIYFGGSDAKTTKTILITSPAPGDGKTTLASNLAIAVAQAGRRVLLIDADCRRPMQHRIFNGTDKRGLTSILSGEVSLVDAAQKTNVEKLDILPCGPLPENPSEILDSPALINLLEYASEIYDQILIDSPPVMPVTDARILAASCHATVLVLRADRSTRRAAEHARDALQSVGADLIGIVVNDVPRGKNGSGYFYHYGYGYGYYTSRLHNSERNGNGNGDRHANGNGNGHRPKVESVVVTHAVVEDSSGD
jgi:capsular exopolysaccharide synthesis family protein